MQESLFFSSFEKQDFSTALDAFNQLTAKEQELVLKQLYYQCRESKTPIAISVLYRQLREGRTFDDFYNAWLPPQNSMKPFAVGGKTYHQFFETPVRVLNAVNMTDPNEVISIGLVWCENEEELQSGLKQTSEDKNNIVRGDNIANVAEKISSKIYKTYSDTNLGN